MNPVRKLLDDLVRKRLWPIALLLVVALVAIPVVIGGSSEPAGSPDVAAIARPGVDRLGRGRGRARRAAAGALAPRRDPRPVPAHETQGGVEGVCEEVIVVIEERGAVEELEATPRRRARRPSSPAKPKPPVTVPVEPGAAVVARSVFETTAHFTGPRADYEHPLDRLAVFGETDSPALQYLGVSRGGEYAIFLLGPAATAAAGEVGACIVADPCRAIGLRRGDKLSVQVTDPGAAARDYTLEVTSLRRVARASPAVAQREREHVAKGGREVLRTIADDVPTATALGQLRYGPATGTVTLVSAS